MTTGDGVSARTETRTLHVVTVFVGPGGRGGNPLGVFLDAADLDAARRQRIAADLGYSETVFVADAAAGRLWIHTPEVELPLAGHPLVGTSWLLTRRGTAVDTLRPPAGEVPTWTADDQTWIRANPNWAPEFTTVQLASAAEVDAHPGGEPGGPDLHVWAWENEAAGLVRARVFPVAMGIAEDEATGAAALRLGQRLGRPLVIRQGVGSQLLVAIGPDGTVEVGGRVRALETRAYSLP